MRWDLALNGSCSKLSHLPQVFSQKPPRTIHSSRHLPQLLCWSQLKPLDPSGLTSPHAPLPPKLGGREPPKTRDRKAKAAPGFFEGPAKTTYSPGPILPGSLPSQFTASIHLPVSLPSRLASSSSSPDKISTATPDKSTSSSPELNSSNQSGPPALSPNWISVTNTEGAEDGNSISSPASKKSDTSNSAVVSLAWMVQVKHATSKAKKKRWRAREVGMMMAACARPTHNTTQPFGRLVMR